MLKKIKAFYKIFCASQQRQSFTPAYRIVKIDKTETVDYVVTVQLINKSIVFKTSPEEILKNDRLVDQFSPRNIRTLTYLGYLSVNSPKYKILAQRLAKDSDKVLFALQKKGERKIIVKTANEILKEEALLNNLNSKDSHRVGYALATENLLEEKLIKEQLKILKKKK